MFFFVVVVFFFFFFFFFLGGVFCFFFFFSCFVLFVVLMLCLVGPVWHCDKLIGKEGAGCFRFLLFVMYVVCSLFYIRLCSVIIALLGNILYYLASFAQKGHISDCHINFSKKKKNH